MDNLLHIIHHVGLGDHYVCKGIVVEKLKEYKKVIVYSLNHNIKTVKALYGDLKDKVIIEEVSINNVKNWRAVDNFIINLNNGGQKTFRVGFRYIEHHKDASFDDSFYIQSNINFDKKWDNFDIDSKYINKNPENKGYAFVHMDRNRGYNIDITKISLPIVEPVGKENALEYIKDIQSAHEIHCIDSSFLNLVDLLKYKGYKFCCEDRIYYHYYSRKAAIGAQPHLKCKWIRFDEVPKNIIKNEILKCDRMDLFHIKNNKMFLCGVGILNNENVGDRYNNPLLYFDFGINSLMLDIRKIKLHDHEHDFYDIQKSHIFVGGGGLLWQFHSQMENLYNIRKGCLIGWGFGVNSHNTEEYDKVPGYLHFYDLVGIRDYGLCGINYLPCVSCMNKVFDKNIKITDKVVVYSHVDNYIDSKEYKNICNYNSLENVINHIGSCEVLVTNNWHGVYWGNLLNKRVLIYKPFSSRFNHFKLKNVTINSLDEITDDNINKCEVYDNYLSECREYNEKYYKIVKELVF
jgi:hypothetical protein